MKVTILDYAWLRYADLQQRSTKVEELCDYSWGIEAALDYLLRVIETGAIPSSQLDLDAALTRAIASGARLRRSRSLALRTWLVPPESLTTNSAAVASVELDRIGLKVKEPDGKILLDAGFGYTDREIAHRHKSTPGAIRVRLSRLRSKLIEKRRSEPQRIASPKTARSIGGARGPDSQAEMLAA